MFFFFFLDFPPAKSVDWYVNWMREEKPTNFLPRNALKENKRKPWLFMSFCPSGVRYSDYNSKLQRRFRFPEGWIEGDAKKGYGNCHLLAEPVCLTDDDFSLGGDLRMHRLTFWFPLLFSSFYLFYFFPFASVVVCLLSSFYACFYVFLCLWSTPNKGLGDGEGVHV